MGTHLLHTCWEAEDHLVATNRDFTKSKGCFQRLRSSSRSASLDPLPETPGARAAPPAEGERGGEHQTVRALGVSRGERK